MPDWIENYIYQSLTHYSNVNPIKARNNINKKSSKTIQKDLRRSIQKIEKKHTWNEQYSPQDPRIGCHILDIQ